MSDQRGKQWCRMVRAVWFRGHPGQFALLWRKRQVMARKSPFRRRTHQIHLLSALEKIEHINLIGLSRSGEKTSELIGWGRTKQTQRHV